MMKKIVMNLSYNSEGALYNESDSEDGLCDASENKAAFNLGHIVSLAEGMRSTPFLKSSRWPLRNGLFVPWICYLVYLQNVAKLQVVLTPQM